MFRGDQGQQEGAQSGGVNLTISTSASSYVTFHPKHEVLCDISPKYTPFAKHWGKTALDRKAHQKSTRLFLKGFILG